MAVDLDDVFEAAGAFALDAELASRTAALALGNAPRADQIEVPSTHANVLDAAEQRAVRIARAGGACEESRRNAAFDFLSEVAATLALDADALPGQIGAATDAAAAQIGFSRRAASLLVFQRALGARQIAELPPPLAYRAIVALVLEFAPAEAVSLWTMASLGRAECIASAGDAATSRRMRLGARVVLDGADPSLGVAGSYVRGVIVERWDGAHAALVVRSRPDPSGRLGVYLTEAAAALSPFFEREMLFERNAAREHSLVSASERRLTRLGCDLHDGPLQEIVAFAAELRRAREQVSSILEAEIAGKVRGLFDDLEARLAALDEGLRDVSLAIRSTTAEDRPLELGLRTEVDAFNRTSGIVAQLSVQGDISELTASQSIVCFRVVQESLANARKHSGAGRVRVSVRSTARYVSISVTDDGRGFDVDAARHSGRLGLTGVIARVRLLGGDIDIDSAPGQGTRVRATLPRWTRPVSLPTVAYSVGA